MGCRSTANRNEISRIFLMQVGGPGVSTGVDIRLRTSEKEPSATAIADAAYIAEEAPRIASHPQFKFFIIFQNNDASFHGYVTIYTKCLLYDINRWSIYARSDERKAPTARIVNRKCIV
jgi:hypothetical protein